MRATTELDELPTESTRKFERFQTEFIKLQLFRTHLLSVDGKARTEKVANEMVVDVCDFVVGLSPKNLISSILLTYLDKVKRAGLKVGGRLAKLDTFEAALRFMRANDDPDDQIYKQSLHMSEVLRQWKGTWRPEKQRTHAVRMQQQSERNWKAFRRGTESSFRF